MSIFRRVQQVNPPGDTTESIFQKNTLSLVSDVIVTYNTYPATGVYSEENIEGWKWSKTFPQELNSDRNKINSSVGGSNYSLEEGSLLNNWQGAVLSGIELEKIKETFIKTSSKWVPEYTTGAYSIYHKEKRLNSNFSLCKTLKEEIDDGSVANFFENIIYNESIAIYKRDKRFVNFPFYKYVYDEDLKNPNSYSIDIDSESKTSSIEVNEVKKIKTGGDLDLVSQEVSTLETWEYSGMGNPGRSIIYTEYFPVDKESFNLVELDADGETFEDWTRVSKFTYTGQKEYILDALKGIVRINSIEVNSSQRAKSIELVEPIVHETDADGQETMVPHQYHKVIFFESKRNNIPETGLISIEKTVAGDDGGESRVTLECNYYDYNGKSLIVKATMEQLDSFILGHFTVIFKLEGQNFASGSNLFLSYTAVPRVDYEVVNDQKLLLRSDPKIDLKPYRAIENSGLIEINPYEKHIDRIDLSSDLAPGATLKMGIESLKLQATVLNSSGGRVKEADVFFYCDFGYFNNGNKNFFSKSNKEGEAFSYYYYPYSEKDSYIWVTGENIEHVDSNTVLKVRKERSSTSNGNVCIFQTLKVDPFYGYYGQKLIVEGAVTDGDYIEITFETNIEDIDEYIGNEMMFLENETQTHVELCKGSTNNHSFGFLKANGTSTKFIILNVKGKDTIITKPGFFQDPDGDLVAGAEIFIYKSNELEYDYRRREETGLSFDRLMYIDNGETNLTPLYPNSYDTQSDNNNILIKYENSLLPLAQEQMTSNIVAGYKIFLNKKARIYAEAQDPATGRVIKSNTLTIDVSLPDFLTSAGGFEISGEEHDGNGLGGSTFLKLEQHDTELQTNTQILYNPFKNGINIIIDNTEEQS